MSMSLQKCIFSLSLSFFSLSDLVQEHLDAAAFLPSSSSLPLPPQHNLLALLSKWNALVGLNNKNHFEWILILYRNFSFYKQFSCISSLLPALETLKYLRMACSPVANFQKKSAKHKHNSNELSATTNLTSSRKVIVQCNASASDVINVYRLIAFLCLLSLNS